MNKDSKKILGIIIAVVVLAGLLVWLLKPEANQIEQPTITENTGLAPDAASSIPSTTTSTSNKALPELAASLQGTEIDCPIQVDKNDQLILTVGIRNCFDYFYSSLGEKTEQQLTADIKQYLQATLPFPAATYASKLLDQYVAYKYALQKLQPSAQQQKNITAEIYQQIVNSIRDVQRQFFNLAEIDAFFGTEQIFNQYNIEQMKINADKSLNAQQKAEKLAALIDQLPPEMAAGIRPSMQVQQLDQLTDEIKNKGGSATELRQMRESLVGVAAADRLEALDKADASWETQVNSYLAQRDQIKNSGLDEVGKQQAMAALRERTFTSNEERLRAQTFESMHDTKK
ncbi:lipase secretion chaperone [Acinetobacter junii]|uniref:lipase secretion chaperone n=1 Tax=Acinetobacter junii TaxID=40215 RepID=UPI003215846B